MQSGRDALFPPGSEPMPLKEPDLSAKEVRRSCCNRVFLCGEILCGWSLKLLQDPSSEALKAVVLDKFGVVFALKEMA